MECLYLGFGKRISLKVFEILAISGLVSWVVTGTFPATQIRLSIQTSFYHTGLIADDIL